ncbi:MAG: hypothetical protein KJ597_02860 [Nanoarchaeota archaeon]|nr:hypothetical protein [Nanoarchaeota archaeon]MBU1622490.1 hypothetical protein [Nanoarchaeota archaeon]
MKIQKELYVWTSLRLGLGLIFLWAFFDKLLGLGFATTADKSWLAGNSPTAGFLMYGVHGPLSSLYNSLAGNAFVDWIFMLGLLLIGSALVLGIGVKIAGYSGALMMFLMWTSLLPPENHPFLDEHVIFLIVLIGLTTVKSSQWFGLGEWWSKTKLVKEYRFLE